MQAHRIRRDPPAQRPPAARTIEPAHRRARAEPEVEVEAGPNNTRRVVSAFASSIVPGSGQLINLRWRTALIFGLPVLFLVGLAVLVSKYVPAPQLLALAMAPPTIVALLVVNAVIFGWQVLAAGQAFFDRRFDWAPSKLSAGALALILVVTAIPHLFAASIGLGAMNAFSSIFSTAAVTGGVAGAQSGPLPVPGGRVNILLIGVDSGAGRDHALTDSMMVVSIDPVGHTASLLSLPRDMVNAPLDGGQTYAPKLNSLMSYATAHPAAFPAGGMRTLEDTIGLILGIPIHYYVYADLQSFVNLVDALGGIDINIAKALDDPTYHGYGVHMGWSITAGPHHLDGSDALAYARIRHPVGESDFTRQARQQALLVALKHQLTSPDLVLRLPALIAAVGQNVETDLPRDQLPSLAAIASEMGPNAIFQVVIKIPLVKPETISPYGSVQVPNLVRIRAMAAALFSTPGTEPVADPKASAPPAPIPGASSGPSSGPSLAPSQ